MLVSPLPQGAPEIIDVGTKLLPARATVREDSEEKLRV